MEEIRFCDLVFKMSKHTFFFGVSLDGKQGNETLCLHSV